MKHVPLSTLNKVVAIACFALAGSALAVPAPPVCPDTGVSQLTTDLTAPGDTTTIGGSIFTAVDTNGSRGFYDSPFMDWANNPTQKTMQNRGNNYMGCPTAGQSC